MTKPIVPQDVAADNIYRLGDTTDALCNLLADALNAVMHQEVAAQLNAVMHQEVAAQLNADTYEGHEDRAGYRNGTRPRRFDTRMGTRE